MRLSGLLFGGRAERGLWLDQGFVSAGILLAFGFRKAGSWGPQLGSRRRTAPAIIVAKAVRAKPGKPELIAKTQPKSASAETTIATTEHWIEQARHLANQGKLVEALKCCEQNLRIEPASAETYHLIGLLHDAAGRVCEAAEHYRKA